MAHISLTREFYIPQHPSAIIRNKQGTAVVYFVDSIGDRPHIAATGFYGKAIKPSTNYSYRSIEHRARAIANWFASIDKMEASKAEYRAKRNAFRHTLKVGDMLRCSWGYDQTNIDYYQVTKLIGDVMVEIRAIRAETTEETGWLQGKCVPVAGSFKGKPMRKRVSEGNAVRIASYASAYPVETVEVAGSKFVKSADHWTAYH